jgi:RNase H-fold protein (predicted Holliday junction resolvase)
MNMKADARRRVVDKVAAAVILQSWLDHRRAAGPSSAEIEPGTDP